MPQKQAVPSSQEQLRSDLSARLGVNPMSIFLVGGSSKEFYVVGGLYTQPTTLRITDLRVAEDNLPTGPIPIQLFSYSGSGQNILTTAQEITSDKLNSSALKSAIAVILGRAADSIELEIIDQDCGDCNIHPISTSEDRTFILATFSLRNGAAELTPFVAPTFYWPPALEIQTPAPTLEQSYAHDWERIGGESASFLPGLDYELRHKLNRYEQALALVPDDGNVTNTAEREKYQRLILALELLKRDLQTLRQDFSALPSTTNASNAEENYMRLLDLGARGAMLDSRLNQIGWVEELENFRFGPAMGAGVFRGYGNITGPGGYEAGQTIYWGPPPSNETLENTLMGGRSYVNSLLFELNDIVSNNRTENNFEITVEDASVLQEILYNTRTSIDTALDAGTEQERVLAVQLVLSKFNEFNRVYSSRYNAAKLETSMDAAHLPEWQQFLGRYGVSSRTVCDAIALGAMFTPFAPVGAAYFVGMGADGIMTDIGEHGGFEVNARTMGSLAMIAAPCHIPGISQVAGTYLLFSAGTDGVNLIADNARYGLTPEEWGRLWQDGIFVGLGVYGMRGRARESRVDERVRSSILEGVLRTEIRIPGLGGRGTETFVDSQGRARTTELSELTTERVLTREGRTELLDPALATELRGLQASQDATVRSRATELLNTIENCQRAREYVTNNSSRIDTAFTNRGETPPTGTVRDAMVAQLEDAALKLPTSTVDYFLPLIMERISRGQSWGTQADFNRYAADYNPVTGTGFSPQELAGAYQSKAKLSELDARREQPTVENLGQNQAELARRANRLEYMRDTTSADRIRSIIENNSEGYTRADFLSAGETAATARALENAQQPITVANLARAGETTAQTLARLRRDVDVLRFMGEETSVNRLLPALTESTPSGTGFKWWPQMPNLRSERGAFGGFSIPVGSWFPGVHRGEFGTPESLWRAWEDGTYLKPGSIITGTFNGKPGARYLLDVTKNAETGEITIKYSNTDISGHAAIELPGGATAVVLFPFNPTLSVILTILRGGWAAGELAVNRAGRGNTESITLSAADMAANPITAYVRGPGLPFAGSIPFERFTAASDAGARVRNTQEFMKLMETEAPEVIAGIQLCETLSRSTSPPTLSRNARIFPEEQIYLETLPALINELAARCAPDAPPLTLQEANAFLTRFQNTIKEILRQHPERSRETMGVYLPEYSLSLIERARMLGPSVSTLKTSAAAEFGCTAAEIVIEGGNVYRVSETVGGTSRSLLRPLTETERWSVWAELSINDLAALRSTLDALFGKVDSTQPTGEIVGETSRLGYNLGALAVPTVPTIILAIALVLNRDNPATTSTGTEPVVPGEMPTGAGEAPVVQPKPAEPGMTVEAAQALIASNLTLSIPGNPTYTPSSTWATYQQPLSDALQRLKDSSPNAADPSNRHPEWNWDADTIINVKSILDLPTGLNDLNAYYLRFYGEMVRQASMTDDQANTAELREQRTDAQAILAVMEKIAQFDEDGFRLPDPLWAFFEICREESLNMGGTFNATQIYSKIARTTNGAAPDTSGNSWYLEPIPTAENPNPLPIYLPTLFSL